MNRWKLLLALISAGALLGFTTVLAKVAGRIGMTPITLLAWSTLGAAWSLGLFRWRFGDGQRLTMRVVIYFVTSAALSFVVPNLLLFSAIPHVGAGFASLALALPPTLTYLGAVAVGLDRVDRWRVTAVGLALLGVGMLASAKGLEDDVPWVWLAVTLLAPIALAAGNIYRTMRWPVGLSVGALAPGLLGAAALQLILVGFTPWSAVRFPETTDDVLLISLQSTVFALLYPLYFFVQQQGGPVYLSLIGSIAALVAVPLSIFALQEGLPTLFLPAAIMIGISLLIMSRSGAPRVDHD